MAACLLRKLANLQRICSISQKIGMSRVSQCSSRKIHVSPIALQTYFSDKHEWIDVPEGSNEGTVGITDYAQDKLGEIVYVQLPELGDLLEADGEAGVLESVKAASDIYSPVTGEVTARNDSVVDNPKIINENPSDEGWLFKVALSEPNELTNLMDEAAYKAYLKTVE